ncbi:MAG: FkbM family methyltransferase [Mesorhizobium sp.]|nr:FkbM family methyltransferase [Mesorhizobium sp.]
MANTLKQLSRDFRLGLYKLKQGEKFDYHSIKVAIPDHIPFTFKRQVMQGKYEEAERRLVDAYLDAHLPVIEAGGSLGILSAYISSKLAPETPYWVIEANPDIVDICAENVKSRPRNIPVQVHNYAIAYGAETISFAKSENVHISRLSSSALPGNIEVAARTLGQIVSAMGVEQGYSLVMDIEGAEFDVFERDAAALASCRLAIVEIHPHIFEQQGRNLSRFIELVNGTGMKVANRHENTLALTRG